MKSIIEEASSITKAIEAAWKRANQPNEFSVRIFEMPQKNMFGFTTKSAKIGIFFEEGKKSERAAATPQPSEHKQRAVKPQVHKEKEVEKKQPAPQAKPRRAEQQEATDPWNKEMVCYVQQWIDTLLAQLNVEAQVVVVPERYHLKITFNKSIFEQEEKNRALFRSVAFLLLQSVRNTFKRPLKGFKVVLTVQ